MTWTRGPSHIVLVAALVLAANPCEAGCTISTTGVSFGSYDVYSATALDSTGSVTYNCGVGTLLVSVDLSKGASASFDPRTLQNGPQALNYNLYTDAARSSIWGDATTGTSNYSATLPPLNTNVTVTVYGRVPPLQDVAAGTYADTVVVTVNF